MDWEGFISLFSFLFSLWDGAADFQTGCCKTQRKNPQSDAQVRAKISLELREVDPFSLLGQSK